MGLSIWCSVFRARCLRVAAAVVLPAAVTGGGMCALPKPAAKPGDPAITLQADRYGYLPLPVRTLTSGATMFTLHFVDETHLLFTFHTHGLMTRLPDSGPDDNDRHVTAVLIELPTGKEVARTVWRTRDQDQYLWPLGHGRFLLRIRSKLSLIEPVRGLAEGNAFAERTFLEFKRRIGYIAISPGGDLLSVETLPPRAQQAAGAAATMSGPAVEADSPARSAVDVRFYRLLMEESAGRPEQLIASAAGGLLTNTMIHIPATAEGFLDMTRDGTAGYLFDFQSHTGKRTELAGYETACLPRSVFISRSEFVAFGCQMQGQVLLSEFNLRGQEPWVQVLSAQAIAPMIQAAPAAGRFALSRILTGTATVDLENLLPEEMTAQEITVLQNHDGRQLLKTRATPIQRAGQNFDLSSDGLEFATLQTTQSTHGDETIQNTKIVVYRLPGLTAVDQKEVKLAEEATPEKNSGMVRLLSSKAKTGVPGEKVTVQTRVATTPVETIAAPAPKATVGDVTPDDAPRKPPSLYDADHPKTKPPDR